MDLARAVAEPALLGQGPPRGTPATTPCSPRACSKRRPRRAPPAPGRAAPPGGARAGPHALRAAPRGPAARHVQRLADRAAPGEEDARRLQALARLYRRFHETVEGRFADPATLLRAAARAPRGRALAGRRATCLVVDDLELDAAEREFLAALARALPGAAPRARRGRRACAPRSFARLGATAHGIAATSMAETVLAPLAPAAAAGRRSRGCAARSSSRPRGEPARDGSVELLTAPGEAAEVRAIVRRLLREAARGVPFEEMGVHPAAAARSTRRSSPTCWSGWASPTACTRRCRCASAAPRARCCCSSAAAAWPRPAVMEFLTFAPVPFAELLGRGATPRARRSGTRSAATPASSPASSAGSSACAPTPSRSATRPRRETRARSAAARGCSAAGDAEALLRVVELLVGTLDAPRGRGRRGRSGRSACAAVVDQWIGPRAATARRCASVIADLRRPRLRSRRRARLGRGRGACSRRASSGSACRSSAGRARRRPRGRARRHGRPALPRGRDPGPGRGRLSRACCGPTRSCSTREREALAAPARRRAAAPPAARPRRARGSSRSSTTSRDRPPPAPGAASGRLRHHAGPRCWRRAARSIARSRQATRAADPLLPARRPAHRPRAAAVALLRGRRRRAGGPAARRGASSSALVREDDLDALRARRRARPLASATACRVRAGGERGGAARSPPARRSSGSRTWPRRRAGRAQLTRLRRPRRLPPRAAEDAAPRARSIP